MKKRRRGYVCLRDVHTTVEVPCFLFISDAPYMKRSLPHAKTKNTETSTKVLSEYQVHRVSLHNNTFIGVLYLQVVIHG